MNHIATGILLDKNGNLLAYLRDDKSSIPFPNHWDLFGGYVESGETSEEALVREVKEELGYDLQEYYFYKKYESLEKESHQNTKHVYVGNVHTDVADLTLHEGQELRSIPWSEVQNYKWANILRNILEEFSRELS